MVALAARLGTVPTIAALDGTRPSDRKALADLALNACASDCVYDVTINNGRRQLECCGDWDCPKGTECKHGVCEFECKHDKDCPDHTCCCKSGHCSKHCCDDHKKPEKPQKPGEPGVDTLPSTGSGDTASGAGWLGAAALGAAAFAVGKTLRDGATPVPEARSEE